MADDALIDVVFRALKDEKFFEDLTRDAPAALRDAHIALSDEEIGRLTRALQHPTRIDVNLSELLQAVHRHHFFGGPKLFGRWVGFSWVDVLHDYRDRKS